MQPYINLLSLSHESYLSHIFLSVDGLSLHPFNSLTLPHFNITQNKQRKRQGSNISVVAARKHENRKREVGKGKTEKEKKTPRTLSRSRARPPANSDEPLFVRSSSWTLEPKPKGKKKIPPQKGGKKGKNCRHQQIGSIKREAKKRKKKGKEQPFPSPAVCHSRKHGCPFGLAIAVHCAHYRRPTCPPATAPP